MADRADMARLLFYMDSGAEHLLKRVSTRLQLDFSPAEQMIPAGTGIWYVSQEPFHLEEFPVLVKHVRRLEQLFSKDGQIRIIAGYLTAHQLVIGTDALDPTSIFLAPGVYAKILASGDGASAKLHSVASNAELTEEALLVFDKISKALPA